jgi:hypothetical protein
MRFRQGSQRCAIRAPRLSHEYKRHIDCLLSISPWESGGRKQRCIPASSPGANKISCESLYEGLHEVVHHIIGAQRAGVGYERSG